MNAVIEKVRSAKSGLTEACASLLTGFEASLLAAAAHTTEIAALKLNLERSEDELGLAKKQLEENKGSTTEVATLKQLLTEAENKAAKERTE